MSIKDADGNQRDDRLEDEKTDNDAAGQRAQDLYDAERNFLASLGGVGVTEKDVDIKVPDFLADKGVTQKYSTLTGLIIDLTTGTPADMKKYRKLANLLVGNANANEQDVLIAWSNALSFAAGSTAGSIPALLKNASWKKAILKGTSYEAKADTSYNNRIFNLSDQSTAYTAVNDAIGQWLGRPATAAEKKDFYRKLIIAQKKNPGRNMGTGGANGTQTTIGGGVNADKFAQQYVLGKITTANPDLKGQLGDAQDIIISTATKNGIDMSQAASIALVKRIAKGESVDTIKNELSLRAQKKYTALADQLKANPGATVYDLSSEYLNEMANTLEIPVAQLKIQDIEPAIANIDKEGKQRMLATWEWRKQLRADQRFQYTNKAKGEATDMARSFARSFGVNV